MKLYKHQQDAVAFAIRQKGKCAIYHEIGMGKTLTALALYKMLSGGIKLLVICPLSLIEAAWGDDIAKFTDKTWHNLHKHKFPEEYTKDIYVMNYEMLLNKKHFISTCNMLMKYPTMIVCDESARFRNHRSITAKRMLALAPLARYRILLSGTPAPNIESEYWTQMRFMRPEIFHGSFYAFRNQYFHLERGGQRMIQRGSYMTRQEAYEIFSKGWQYAITDANRKKLIARIAPYCHWAKKADALDLPDTVDEIRYVEMTKEQGKIYNEMKRHLVVEIQREQIAAPLALTKLMKLRELSSNFILNSCGEAKSISEKNPKTKELMEILEQAGNQQVIIICQFRYEIESLMAVLGEKACSLYGKTKDKLAPVNEFRSGNKQYLIGHPKSMGHGLTLTNSNLMIFYSLDYSWESYTQAKGRIHRMTQENKCTYIHILAKDTIDEQIYKVLQRKGNAQGIVMEFMRNGK